MAVGRVLQRHGRNLGLRDGQDVHAFDLRRADRHGRGAEAAVQKELRDKAAERVAHDDGRSAETADDPVVVIGDFLDPEPLVPGGIPANLLHRPLKSRPGRREHGMTLRLEALFPAFPAERREPEAVDEDDGRFLRRRGGVGYIRGHGAPSGVGVRVPRRDYASGPLPAGPPRRPRPHLRALRCALTCHKSGSIAKDHMNLYHLGA